MLRHGVLTAPTASWRKPGVFPSKCLQIRQTISMEAVMFLPETEKIASLGNSGTPCYQCRRWTYSTREGDEFIYIHHESVLHANFDREY